MTSTSKPKDPFTPKTFYEGVKSGRIKLKPYTSVAGEGTTNFYVKSPGNTYGITVLDMSNKNFFKDLEGFIPATVDEANEFEQRKYAESPEGRGLAIGTAIANVPLVGTAPSVLARAGVDPKNLEAVQKYNSGIGLITELATEVALAAGTSGASIFTTGARKAAKKAAEIAAREAAERAAREAAKKVTKEATEKVTKESVVRTVAREGLKVLNTPSAILNSIGEAAGRKVLNNLPGTIQGSILGKAAKTAVDVGSQAAIYSALSGMSQRDIAGGEGKEIFAIDAILQDLMGVSLLGAGTGGSLSLLGQGAAKAGGFLKGKVSESAKKIYPWILGEDTASGPLDRGTRDLLSPAQIEFANAVGLKGEATEEIAQGADAIMGASSRNNPNDSIIQSGLNVRENSKRVVDYVDEIGSELGGIYKKAADEGVTLNQKTSDLVKEFMAKTAPDGVAYEKGYLKQQERIFKEAIEPFTNKKPDINEINKTIKNIDTRKDILDNSTDILPENKQPISDAIKAIHSVMTSAKPNDQTYTGHLIDSLKEFSKSRDDYLLKGSDSYNANTATARKYIMEFFDETTRLTATDIGKIKQRLRENESLFEKGSNPVAKKIAGNAYTFFNKKLAESIVESITDPALQSKMANDLDFLTNTYAKTRPLAKEIARRFNLTSMHDKKGLLTRVSEMATGGSPLVGSVVGGMFGGPVGAGVGMAAGMLKSSYSDLSKTVFPGVRARRAYAKAGIIVADTQTRGALGKLERAIEGAASFFEEKSNKKQTKKPKTSTMFPRALVILGLNQNSSEKEKEEKVAQYSDKVRRQALGTELMDSENSIANNISNGFVDAFGQDNEMPEIQAAVQERAVAVQSQLLSILPVGPSFLPTNPYTPLAKLTWRASPTATIQSMRAIEAVQDPITELSGAAQGDINFKSLVLVKTAYPELYNGFLDGLIKKIMANSEKPLSMEDKATLDALTFGTKYASGQFSSDYNLYSKASSAPSVVQAQQEQSGPSSGRQGLTQNATKNIGKISKSVRTFGDTVGTVTT